MRQHVVYTDATHRYEWVPSQLRQVAQRGRIEEWRGATCTRISDSIPYGEMGAVALTMVARRLFAAVGVTA